MFRKDLSSSLCIFCNHALVCSSLLGAPIGVVAVVMTNEIASLPVVFPQTERLCGVSANRKAVWCFRKQKGCQDDRENIERLPMWLMYYLCNQIAILTHKQLETHGCLLSTVATDALVLKHQGISSHSADLILIALEKFHRKILPYIFTVNNILK